MYFSIKKRSFAVDTNTDQEPPVFPWETEVTDYPETSGDLSTPLNEQTSLENGHDQEDPSPSPR